MTVTRIMTPVQYATNGVQTVFPYYDRIFQDSDLEVYLLNSLNQETRLTLNVDYTVTGAGLEAGGTVVCASPPATGQTLTIRRAVALTQTAAYLENDPFPAVGHEAGLDKLVMMVQQLQEQHSRTLHWNPSYQIPGVLPPPVPMAVLSWDTLGRSIMNRLVDQVVEVPEIDYLAGNYHNSLAELVATVGSVAPKEVLINQMAAEVTADLEVTPNFTLWINGEGRLRVVNCTLTLNCLLAARTRQIFECVGTGKVVLGPTIQAYPEWWGAVMDDETVDCAPHFNAAMEAVSPRKVVLGGGTYHIGSTLAMRATLEGESGVTVIKAQAAFSGTMMADWYTGYPNIPELDQQGIIWDGNHVAGLHGWYSSNGGGRGNARHNFECLRFRNFREAYAIRCHNSGGDTRLPGFLAGATFSRMQFDACDGLIYPGANADDIMWQNCRFNFNSDYHTLQPIQVSGLDNSFETCFWSLQKDIYDPGTGVIAPVKILSPTCKIDGAFIESYGTMPQNATHIFHLGTQTKTHYALWNIYTNLNNAGAPNLAALIFAQVGNTADRNFPVLDLWNFRDHTDVAGAVPWKIVDVFVSNTAVDQALTINMGGLDFYDFEDIFRYHPLGISQALPSVWLFGPHKGKVYAHGCTDQLGAVPPLETPVLARLAIPGLNIRKGWSQATGTSPVTSTYQLPAQGKYEIDLCVYVQNTIHMATRSARVNWFNDTNTVLTVDYLEAEANHFTAGVIAIDHITISAPDASGLVTAQVSWTGGGSYVCTFHWKVTLKHNYKSDWN